MKHDCSGAENLEIWVIDIDTRVHIHIHIHMHTYTYVCI